MPVNSARKCDSSSCFSSSLIRRDGFADIGQRARDRDDFIDRPIEAWRDQRPGFRHGAPDLIVDAIERQTVFVGLDYLGGDIGGIASQNLRSWTDRPMLGDKRCPTVNNSITTRGCTLDRA